MSDHSKYLQAGGLTIAISLAASTFGIGPQDVLSPRRGPNAASHGRHLAIYLAHVVLGLNFSALASIFARDRASIRHAVARIEDRRDDPGFDLWISALETCILPFRLPAQEC